MRKIILVTSQTCGPCFVLRKRIKDEKIKVEEKEYSENNDFFTKYEIRSVPRLLIMEDDEVVESVQGSDDIINRIKEENKN